MVEAESDCPAETMGPWILHRPKFRNFLLFISQNLPCAVRAPIIDNNNLMGYSTQGKLKVEMCHRRGNAPLFIPSRDYYGKQTEFGIIHEWNLDCVDRDGVSFRACPIVVQFTCVTIP